MKKSKPTYEKLEIKVRKLEHLQIALLKKTSLKIKKKPDNFEI